MKRYMEQLGICLVALCVGVLFTRCEKDHLMIKPENLQKPEGDGICGTVTDKDGNVYDVVKLGNQEWMAQNLRTTKYADGTSIPLGSSTSTTTAYRYCPNNSSSNVYKYGYLYNWKAVMRNSSSSSSNPSHVQGICPNGWHVPSDAEWTELENYVRGVPYYMTKSGSEGKALASSEDWGSSPNYLAIGNDVSINNSTGFCAVPAGCVRNGTSCSFNRDADYWTTNSSSNSDAYAYGLYSSNSSGLVSEHCNQTWGNSVRCVKD